LIEQAKLHSARNASARAAAGTKTHEEGKSDARVCRTVTGRRSARARSSDMDGMRGTTASAPKPRQSRGSNDGVARAMAATAEENGCAGEKEEEEKPRSAISSQRRRSATGRRFAVGGAVRGEGEKELSKELSVSVSVSLSASASASTKTTASGS
jgi:hypothetical protein